MPMFSKLFGMGASCAVAEVFPKLKQVSIASRNGIKFPYYKLSSRGSVRYVASGPDKNLKKKHDDDHKAALLVGFGIPGACMAIGLYSCILLDKKHANDNKKGKSEAEIAA
ncbi:hypothetical protein BZA05DRAFT_416072 [Tricharina praecox]|uniref:uncharacterized protein n=1 Tax=Tricharina praecox TaxID=43433 RepID=UPI002220C68F|nr:uncharacterized protein BZA05DRAFT_416072 [Tricharina praecox]KAI5856383.1 hypothetical protein BZA05DRAFT_416072 [Tricharina praecox]